MRKTLLVLTASLALLLAACGGGTGTSPDLASPDLASPDLASPELTSPDASMEASPSPS